MSSQPSINPDFWNVNLLALYTTMSMKRIVMNKLPWKESLNTLVEEVKLNMKSLGKNKEKYYFATLRELVRIYENQWSVVELKQEIGKPTFQSLLIVLALRLGITKLWPLEYPFYRTDILIDDFLAHNPKLKLTYLSQSDPLYDSMVSLCENLQHVSMPMTDHALFKRTVQIKTLRVLEFSTGVADKNLCHSLWNIDKKSDKVLQMAVKDKTAGTYSLTLPHLEIIRSNILVNKSASNSMKVTFGAAALALQPKLRIVENRRYWSTLEAIEALMEMEEKYRVKCQKQKELAVDRLLFTKTHFKSRQLENRLKKIFDLCPLINTLVITECFSKIPIALLSTLKSKMVSSTIHTLSLDVTGLSEKDFEPLIDNIGRNVKNLTLRLNLKLIDKFHIHKKIENSRDSENLKAPITGSIETLSLILTGDLGDIWRNENGIPCKPTSMMAFLVCFSNISTLNFYNMHWVQPVFVVFGCIGGAVAVIDKLKHLTLSGSSATNPVDPDKLHKEQIREVRNIIPELIDESTFKVLQTLESFTLDEEYLNYRVDNFLDLLRACNVHIQVNYKPDNTRFGGDLARFQNCNEFDELYTLVDPQDSD